MSYDLSIVAAAFCVGIALMVAGMFFKQRTYRKVMLSPDSWFLSEQTVVLDPNGLLARGRYGEVHNPWSSFRYLAEDDKNLYLFLDNTQAFVLPKAAVGSSEQLDQVKAWLPL
jgi:hypothetical protein